MNIQNFLKSISNHLGKENIIIDQGLLSKILLDTSPIDRKVPAIVTPCSKDEVIQCVKTANEFKIPLYPISAGKNWGYGGPLPVQDDCVILDLSKMNRILEVNEKFAYAIVEPGVTQGMLHNWLVENEIDLIIDPSGAGPKCSVLGNCLERGYGIGIYGDHFSTICGMEVVLGDGTVIETGFSRFSNARCDRLFRYGVGPYLDGLFTQSNFGIVTKIGVWLAPKPDSFEACYFFLDDESRFGSLVEAIRNLKLNRVIKGALNLVHRNRSLTLLEQLPKYLKKASFQEREAFLSNSARKRNISLWNGVTGLYGTKDEISAQKKIIKRMLGPYCKKITFLSQAKLNLVRRFQGTFSLLMGLNVKELLSVLVPSFELLQGVPTEVSLPTCYWRSSTAPPEHDFDPAADRCGLMWLSPLVPMEDVAVKDFLNLVRQLFDKYLFEPCITFTTVNDRCFDCTLPILFDRSDQEEVERAEKLYDEALSLFIREGFLPYRYNIKSMESILSGNKAYNRCLEELKITFDPKRIISPGRYIKGC